ncbi:uncharacterized protein MONBRDRAFT_25420 [Monosiga brevicollis MX1]|uniref:Fibronectin type-III domain-containing protein n=1 Tax=Monosiga brevicollis TaxID=81824 RepID=A9UZD3_MONBE|nr:uncharacterized protein MONBRDRAFT_25420 [Monosiga brevicollis MX1]EDQ89211.1 predicted protein [Monosiga brevicollis MX1]|eukprot:XP_001745787.1 hypothetical protein [Monosiga brevicollis MX1]
MARVLPTAQALHAEAVSSTAIRLSWQSPDVSLSSKYVLRYSYRIFRRRQGAPEFALAYTQDDVYHDHVVQGLRAYTTYEFYVQTFTNQLGVAADDAQWPCTPTVTAQTKAAVPSASPTQLRFLVVDMHHLEIAWQPPPHHHQDSLEGYKLFMDVQDSEEFTEINLPASQTLYTANHLRPGTTYRFQVLAFNAAGEGPTGPIISKRTRLPRSQSFTSGQQDDWSLDPDHVEGSEVVQNQKPPSPPPSSRPQPKALGVSHSTKGSFVLAHPVSTQTKSVPAKPASSQESPNQRVAPPRRRLNDAWVVPTVAKAQANCVGPAKPSADVGLTPATPTPMLQTQTSFSILPGAAKAATLSRATWVPCKPNQPTQHQSKPSPIQRLPNDTEMMLATLGNGKATIRGKRHAVRKTLERINSVRQARQQDDLSRVFDDEVQNQRIVIYTTSTTAIRETHIHCEAVKALFYRLRLKVTLKNIAMDKQAADELRRRAPGAKPPQVFVAGTHFGDWEQVERMAEQGTLQRQLQGYAERPLEDCRTCGGEGYVLCTW